jgi:hypothetical protein
MTAVAVKNLVCKRIKLVSQSQCGIEISLDHIFKKQLTAEENRYNAPISNFPKTGKTMITAGFSASIFTVFF